MKDQEEKPIVDNRLGCGTMILILLGVWGLFIFGCIKMCN